MKLTTYKGYDINKIPAIIKAIMKEYEADSLGNITIITDLYKDGRKVQGTDDFQIVKEEQC